MNHKWCDLNGGTILVVRFLSMKRSSMYRIQGSVWLDANTGPIEEKWIECLTECFSQERVSTLSLLFISREDAFLRRRYFLNILPQYHEKLIFG